MDNTRTRTKCVHNRSSQIFKTGSEMCIIRQSVSCHPPSIHPTPKNNEKKTMPMPENQVQKAKKNLKKIISANTLNLYHSSKLLYNGTT